MDILDTAALPDVQAAADHRGLPIQAVGVKGVRYPVTVRCGGECQSTVAAFDLAVGLPAHAKGTHMSRFIELLEAQAATAAIDQAGFRALVEDMLRRLGARSGSIDMRFPWFLRKSAPVSGVTSLLDHEVAWRGTVERGDYRFTLQVRVPVTSLCPCSKQISRYGAHNQRSHVGIEVVLKAPMDVADLVAVAERAASCEVYGLLKRADEKYVTERAYDNPKFVEDLVRDVATGLSRDPRIDAFSVEAENFESIHNHSAFARIAGPQRRAS